MLETKKEESFIELQIPFNSNRKRQTTAVRHKNGKIRVYVKGAPEIVIERCSRTLNKQG
jgi:magnesium-transporting ATPase (P-type)